MFKYIIRRLLLMIPTLVGMTAVVFFIMAGAKGDVVPQLEGLEGSLRPDEIQAMRDYYNQRYGLNKPAYVQYFHWLNHISPVGVKDAGEGFPASWRFGFKAPDMGRSSLRDRPVIQVIGEALPITLLLNFVTIPIIYAISITVGIQAARKKGKAFDVGSGVVFMGLWSLPVMWIGVMFLGYLCNQDYLHWFPTNGLHDLMADRMSFFPHTQNGQFQRGWMLDLLWHLVLPVICLTYGGFAILAKLMRSSVLENLSADFARTARAKGVAEKAVLYRHVLANSLLPMITVAASILPGLLGGSVIVERIFSIQGMGQLMIEAINQRDHELVMSQTVVISIVGLLSVLLADILYVVVDPRVSYD